MDKEESISLREFLEEKIKGIEEKLTAQGRDTHLRFDSLDKALDLARIDAREKYEHLNALRTEVTTDRGLLVKIDSCKQTHNNIAKEFVDVKKEINLLREAKSQVEGRAVEKVETRQQTNWSTGLIVVATLSLLSLLMTAIHMMKG